MSQIKKGQKWRYIGTGGAFFTPGKTYEILSDPVPDDMFQLTDDTWKDGGHPPHHWSDDETFYANFELATGPVRTVTRKEIISGFYGAVKVAPYDDERVFVHVSSTLSAAELREAIATLTEIADALGETS